MSAFLKKNLGLVITTVTLCTGIISSYALLQYRVSQLETRPINPVTLDTIDSRIEKYFSYHKELFQKDIDYLKEEQKTIQIQLQQIMNLLVRTNKVMKKDDSFISK